MMEAQRECDPESAESDPNWRGRIYVKPYEELLEKCFRVQLVGFDRLPGFPCQL
jgi:hypothetical protein